MARRNEIAAKAHSRWNDQMDNRAELWRAEDMEAETRRRKVDPRPPRRADRSASTPSVTPSPAKASEECAATARRVPAYKELRRFQGNLARDLKNDVSRDPGRVCDASRPRYERQKYIAGVTNRPSGIQIRA
jgi:hypothetical protein